MRFLGCLIVATFLFAAPTAFAQQIEGIPNFSNCKDNSLDRAMKDGVTLGISPSPPYSSLDPNSKQAEGLDVEIHQAALNWIGVKDIKYEVAPFGQLIPMMLSKRIDVVASNIHQNSRSSKSCYFHHARMVVRPRHCFSKGKSYRHKVVR